MKSRTEKKNVERKHSFFFFFAERIAQLDLNSGEVIALSRLLLKQQSHSLLQMGLFTALR